MDFIPFINKLFLMFTVIFGLLWCLLLKLTLLKKLNKNGLKNESFNNNICNHTTYF